MIRGGLVTLFVHDVEHAVRFYVETLGMKLAELAESWAVIDAGEGFHIGLHQQVQEVQETAGGAEAEAQRARGATFTPAVGFYPKVPIAEAIAIFENRGVRFEVKQDGPVTLAHFRDPDGNALYLCETR